MRVVVGVNHWRIRGMYADNYALDTVGSWNVWAEDDLMGDGWKDLRDSTEVICCIAAR